MENKRELIDKLCSEITKATCNMLSDLRKALEESGEREIRYYDVNKPVPLDVVGDDGEDVKHYLISKIRYNDGIEIFDENDGWFPLVELDTDSIVDLIFYIVW
jgi:hypothetical protein